MYVDIRLMLLGLILAIIAGCGAGSLMVHNKANKHVEVYMQECTLSATVKSYLLEADRMKPKNYDTGPIPKPTVKKKSK